MKHSKTLDQAEKFYNENAKRLVKEVFILLNLTATDIDWQSELNQVVVGNVCFQSGDMNGAGKGRAFWRNDGADSGFDEMVEEYSSHYLTAALFASDEPHCSEYVVDFVNDLCSYVVSELNIEAYFSENN